MSSTSADLGMNVFGVAAGAVGTLALLHAIISLYLPRHLLHHLDSAAYETDNMLDWATEGGIAREEIENYRAELLSIQTKLYPLRAQSHGAIGWGRQFVMFCCGLSWKLRAILLDLKTLRANVAAEIAREVNDNGGSGSPGPKPGGQSKHGKPSSPSRRPVGSNSPVRTKKSFFQCQKHITIKATGLSDVFAAITSF